jgi:hypothetical protein
MNVYLISLEELDMLTSHSLNPFKPTLTISSLSYLESLIVKEKQCSSNGSLENIYHPRINKDGIV